MKTTINILKYLNRFLISGIILLALVGIFIEDEALFIAMFSTIGLGAFQLIAMLIVFFFWKALANITKRNLFIYFGFILTYVVVYYIAMEHRLSMPFEENYVLIGIPAFLTVFFTITIEMLLKRAKIKDVNYKE